jgi:isopentenyl phosphate kinase
MPVPPNTTVTNRDGKISKLKLGPFDAYLKQGLIPVSFGDLVHDTKRGISICSGDDLMFELAKAYNVKRVIFAMDEGGVFDKNPKKHRDAKLYSFMSEKTIKEWKRGIEEESKRVREGESERGRGGESKRVWNGDATGGIVGKVDICKRISRLGIECLILNGCEKGLLKKALSGKKVRATYF